MTENIDNKVTTGDGWVETTDGWINLITGLAMTGRDKAASGSVYSKTLNRDRAEQLYAGDDLARKIVERIPEDGMRKGIEFCNLDQKIEKGLNDYCKKIDLYSKVLDAWISGRLHGGAGVFVNFLEKRNGNDLKYLSEPVNENAIMGVKSLTVLNRYELNATSNLNSDITSNDFGLPESYILSTNLGNATQFVPIHSSRIIRFDGAKLPSQLFISNQYWHDSVLSAIFQKLSNYNQAYQSSATMLLDFRIAIIRLKHLADMVASGQDQKVKDRMELMKLQKSVLSMILLNEGEDYENHTHSLAGIKDILEKLDDQLVAASCYPHTILLGESPSGLAATGNSEIRDYYDHVAKEQNKVIRKPLNQIFKYIFKAKDGPARGNYPENFDFKFRPLWQLTELEQAKMQLDAAKTDEVYMQNGVLTPDEVALSRFGGKEFSLDTKLGSDKVKELMSNLEGNQGSANY